MAIWSLALLEKFSIIFFLGFDSGELDVFISGAATIVMLGTYE